EANNNVRRITLLKSNIGMLHLSAGEYEKAIAIFEPNTRFYLENDMGRDAVRSMLNLGMAFYKVGNLSKAENTIENALKNPLSKQSPEMTIDALYTLSRIKADVGRPSLALSLAKRSIGIADSTKSNVLRTKAYESLSYAYEKQGDISNALRFHKVLKQYEDSVFNDNKAQAYQQQRVLQEVQAKDQQLREQAFHLASLNKQIELENRWKLMLAVASVLLMVVGFLFYQRSRTKIKYLKELESQNSLIKDQNEEIETINTQLNKQILLRKETDDTINYFATSLFGKNTIDEILWDVAKNCISRLGLVDCVIYLVDRSRGVLIQKAAYGSKNPEDFE